MNSSELKVDFLIKASTALSGIQSIKTQQILRSIYLMRCNQITGHSRLPQKHFSCETRCQHCFIEWTNETERRVKPIKLSKSQRRRIRSNGKLKKMSVNKQYLLHSNTMENVCSFCGHITKTSVIKPSEPYKQIYTKETKEKSCIVTPKVLEKQNINKTNQRNDEKYQSNVYCDSKDAFSLRKPSNTLPSLIKENPKIIKNNKKKKDKLAGLSRAAVLAVSKFKEEKEKQSQFKQNDKNNKLNLFLKPSS